VVNLEPCFALQRRPTTATSLLKPGRHQENGKGRQVNRNVGQPSSRHNHHGPPEEKGQWRLEPQISNNHPKQQQPVTHTHT